VSPLLLQFPEDGHVHTEEERKKISIFGLGRPSYSKGRTYDDIFGKEKSLILRK
jgi:hypothetical protein